MSTVVLTVVLAVVIPVFYAPMFAYQEGLQIFMSSGEFFTDTCLRPGGLSDYIGNFFVQFFMYPHYLFLILALFLITVQLLVKQLFNETVSVVCALAVIAVFTDFNTLFGAVVSVALSFAAVKVTDISKNVFLLCAFTLIIYWIAGGLGCLVFIAGVSVRTDWKVMVSCALVLVFSFLLTKNIMQDDSLLSVFTGVDFNRYPEKTSAVFWTAYCVIILSVLSSLLRIENGKLKTAVCAVAALLLAAEMVIKYDSEKMLYYKVDRMVRYKQWNDIIELASKEKFQSPLTLCYLNLALSEKGLLDSKMFTFEQYGPDGLVSVVIDSQAKSIVNSEIYFRLGVVNIAEELAIDAMESCNTFQKSARQYKRLAEIAVIKNDKPLALRYLKKLETTTFYSAWACQAEKYLSSPSSVEPLSDWKIKPLKVKYDFFFAPSYQSEQFYYLLGSDPQNRKLFNYYTCYLLLEKNLPKLYDFISQCGLEKPVGVHVYEGILHYLEVKKPQEYEKMLSKPDELMRRYLNFKQSRTGGSYWSYFFK